MNYRAILKIYAAERQLTDDETAFLNTLRQMSESERQMFVEGLQDRPHKKASRKSSKKSPRASGIQTQLSKNREQEHQEVLLCAFSDDGDDPTECGEPKSSGIHDLVMGYRNYHPFSSPVSSVVPASIPASSETEESDAGVAAGGSNG